MIKFTVVTCTFNAESYYCPKSLLEAINKMLKLFEESEFKVNINQTNEIIENYVD